jgi:hypothetical protein
MKTTSIFVFGSNLAGRHGKGAALYAYKHPEYTFNLTRIGCGLAGYQDLDIAPMFKDTPNNINKPIG